MLGFSMVDSLARFFNRFTTTAVPFDKDLARRVHDAAQKARARLDEKGLLAVELDAQREVRERVEESTRHAA